MVGFRYTGQKEGKSKWRWMPLLLKDNQGVIGNRRQGSNKGLRRPNIIQGMIQLTADPLAFSGDLFARFLSERHGKPDKLERFEQAVIVLIVDNDVVVFRQELLADERECLLI